MDVATGRDNRLDSTRIARDVDEACDRFEAAWRAGDHPLIEDFLGGTTDSDRPVLLRHLLGVELDYRGGLGESPGPSEYRRRFPGHEGLIDSVFAEFAQRFQVVRGTESETLEIGTGRDGPRSGSATSPPSDVFPNIPGYEIRSSWAAAGWASSTRPGRSGSTAFALKMILLGEHTGAESRARFLAEAETVARLRHPNVVQIYDLGEHDGRPYFEMEYVDGGSLARRLDGTPWAPGPRRGWSRCWPGPSPRPIARGSSTATSSRPTSCSTDDGIPKVADFGLAKTLEADSNLTQTGVFSARRATWPPSRPRARPRRSARRPTSTRWERSSTRC